MWSVHLRGYDPQTGHELDKQDCAISWLPVLLVENSQQQRQTAASVDSFRDRMLASNDQLMRIAHDS